MVAKKWRKHSPEFKAGVVLELLTGKRSAAELAREKRIKDSLVYKWRNEVVERLPELFSTVAPEAQAEDRIGELERLLGQKTIENEALKKASKWLSSVSTKNERQ